MSPANGSGSHDCAPVMWAYGAPCPVMVSPNAGLCKEDKPLYLDHHLIWCAESGFRPTQRANKGTRKAVEDDSRKLSKSDLNQNLGN